jgi:signal peptidase
MRRAGHRLSLLLLLGVAAAWVLVLRPGSLGGPATYIVVRGDSMNPTYATGDLVILERSDAYGPGDVVAYRVPQGQLGAGLVVVHRIIGGDAARGFVVRGDNNPAPDPWSPRGDDVVGRSAVWLPGVGRLVAVLRQPAMLAAICAALIVTLFALPPRRRARGEKPLLGVPQPRWDTWTKPAH